MAACLRPPDRRRSDDRADRLRLFSSPHDSAHVKAGKASLQSVRRTGLRSRANSALLMARCGRGGAGAMSKPNLTILIGAAAMLLAGPAPAQEPVQVGLVLPMT